MIPEVDSLLVTKNFGTGSTGVAISAKDVVLAILQTGRSCRVLSRSVPGDFSSFEGYPIEGFSMARMRKVSSGVMGLKEWVSAFFERRSNSETLERALRRYRPTTVFFNGLGAASKEYLDLCHQQPRRIETVGIVRESPFHFEGNESQVEFRKQLLRSFRWLIFVSDECRREWTRIANLNESLTYYIPNCGLEQTTAAIRNEARSTIRKRLEFPEDKFVWIYPGNICRRKGHRMFKRMLMEKPAFVGPDSLLVLIGSLGDDQQWSKEFVLFLQKEFSGKIEYRGSVNNALEYIYGADGLFFPTRAEAMPRVVIEAMLLNTPVCASRVDGIKELIEDGVSGLLFDRDDQFSMEQYMRSIRDDEILRRALTQNAEERYWTRFSRRQQIERFASFFSQMEGSSPIE